MFKKLFNRWVSYVDGYYNGIVGVFPYGFQWEVWTRTSGTWARYPNLAPFLSQKEAMNAALELKRTLIPSKQKEAYNEFQNVHSPIL